MLQNLQYVIEVIKLCNSDRISCHKTINATNTFFLKGLFSNREQPCSWPTHLVAQLFINEKINSISEKMHENLGFR